MNTGTVVTAMSRADRDVIMVLIKEARKLKKSEKLHDRMAADNIARFLMKHHDVSFEDVFGTSLF